MLNPTILYRIGDSHEIWGIKLDTITVDAHQVPEYIADGWHAHPFDARDAGNAVRLDAVSIEAEPEDKPRRGRPPKAKE